MPVTQSIETETSAKPARKIARDRVATLRFWGVRGSTPTVDKATWRYRRTRADSSDLNSRSAIGLTLLSTGHRRELP